MKSIVLKISLLVITLLFSLSLKTKLKISKGKAVYISKATMDLGRWGARMSEAQKKQIMDNMKNMIEKNIF